MNVYGLVAMSLLLLVAGLVWLGLRELETVLSEEWHAW